MYKYIYYILLTTLINIYGDQPEQALALPTSYSSVYFT